MHGVRHDVPPRMESIGYEILVLNTVAPGTSLAGALRHINA